MRSYICASTLTVGLPSESLRTILLDGSRSGVWSLLDRDACFALYFNRSAELDDFVLTELRLLKDDNINDDNDDVVDAGDFSGSDEYDDDDNNDENNDENGPICVR